MSRDYGNRSKEQRKGGDSLWVGILAGMVIGVAMAAGVAWYLMKSPRPFLNKEQPALAKPDSTSNPATTGKSGATSDGKQRFEFYKILTDKQGATVPAPAKPSDKSQTGKGLPADSKTAASYEPQILQAGSFSSENEAENLKAKLAMLGVEANIQSAAIPDKGVWYRVRVGPYKTADEMNHARNFLKQNGVDSTPMRAQ
ncbi:MAG TPA: SPOR domain-containing protein [Gallionella sp.]|nr:SPOR domain-containing protein [Gallionella sp.]